MANLGQLKRKYNANMRRINQMQKAHEDRITPLHAIKNTLYHQIYEESARPTDEMIKRVEAKLTLEERQYVDIGWKTPPAIHDLEEEWCDD